MTDLRVFALGFVIALIGDAGHVASGTTRYTWPNVPTIGLSAAWFPLLVGAAIVLCARLGRGLGLPSRARTLAQLAVACGAVLALYAVSALFRSLPMAVSTPASGAAALAIWAGWDRSGRSFMLAVLGALLGPLTEITLVQVGAVRWAEDSAALFGVAPWLPCLYFAACSVASGVWRPLLTQRSEQIATNR